MEKRQSYLTSSPLTIELLFSRAGSIGLLLCLAIGNGIVVSLSFAVVTVTVTKGSNRDKTKSGWLFTEKPSGGKFWPLHTLNVCGKILPGSRAGNRARTVTLLGSGNDEKVSYDTYRR